MTAEEWALAASAFFAGLASGLLGMLSTIMRPMLQAMDGPDFRNFMEAFLRFAEKGWGRVFNFAWSLGYINADYLEFIDARGIDVADRREIQNTPEWTASGTLNYEVPMASGRLNIGTTLSYRSRTQQFELRIPGLDQGSYALWDANLVWRSDSDRWTIGLHGRNLTDKRYITSGYNFLRQNPDTGDFILANGQPGLSSTLGAQGVLTAFYGNPRQVYLSVGLNFR